MGELTRGRSGRFVLLAMVLGLVVALAIIVPPGDASGQSPSIIEDDAGVILVSTGPAASDNWIRYYAEPTSPLDVSAYDAHQAINVSRRCEVTTDGSLLALSEGGGTRGIGWVSNGYGVKTKNNCATAEGRMEAGQSLTFALGSFFDDSFQINLAEVDVEGKFNADLGYSYSLDGQGGSVTVSLPNTSDNGPDSGPGDNNIALIEPPTNFDTVTFMPAGSESAAIAIEGGGDGIVAGGTLRGDLGVNQTLFDLVTVETWDGELNCGDVVVETRDPEQEGPADEISLGRGLNLKSSECGLVPYTFQIEADAVLFDTNVEGEDGANFLVRIDWDPADPEIDPFNTPHREIDFTVNGVEDYVPVVKCVSLLVEGPDMNPDPDPNDVYEHPTVGEGDDAIVPWCLAGEKLVLLETGEWQQIQWYDGAGDPRWR